jgi:phage-related protein
VFGHAIDQAQIGKTHPQASRLKGSEFRGVVEVIEDDDGNAYRAFYTVRFKNGIYVLHCLRKKSKQGIAAPKSDLDLVLRRLGEAERHSKAEGK